MKGMRARKKKKKKEKKELHTDLGVREPQGSDEFRGDAPDGLIRKVAGKHDEGGREDEQPSEQRGPRVEQEGEAWGRNLRVNQQQRARRDRHRPPSTSAREKKEQDRKKKKKRC